MSLGENTALVDSVFFCLMPESEGSIPTQLLHGIRFAKAESRLSATLRKRQLYTQEPYRHSPRNTQPLNRNSYLLLL